MELETSGSEGGLFVSQFEADQSMASSVHNLAQSLGTGYRPAGDSLGFKAHTKLKLQAAR